MGLYSGDFHMATSELLSSSNDSTWHSLGDHKWRRHHKMYTGEWTHTVVPCNSTVVVWTDGGGGPLINTEPRKLFSSRFLSWIESHSGFMSSHIGSLCWWEGGIPEKGLEKHARGILCGIGCRQCGIYRSLARLQRTVGSCVYQPVRIWCSKEKFEKTWK